MKPRLCVVGPMLGRNPGRVTTQGERLADLFQTHGYDVVATSSLASRYLRPLDIASTLLKRRRDFDLAVLQVFSGPSFVIEDMSSTVLRSLGCPIIMVLRGGAMPTFAADHPAWVRRVLNRADAIVTPSTFLARTIKPLGYSARVIPNVIELDKYQARVRSRLVPKLFWMRSFHEIYNPALAVRVLALLKQTHPDATLVMAGPDGGQERQTRALAASLGLLESVRMVGFLGPDDKRRAFDAAEIYLNTNRIDNMPVSVVEACASGVPVVATRVGGVPHLLSHGETALLVRNDDAEAMAGAVRTLLGDPALVARLSSNGLALAARSAAENVLPRWTALIDQVSLAGKRPAA